MITLKEHNVKPYAQLCEMLAVHQKCAYIAATGTGKSYVVGKYIEDNDLLDKTLVLVPSTAIRTSWKNLMPGLKVFTYTGLCRGIVDTKGCQLIVCDEMHHLGAAEWGRIYSKAIENFDGKIVGLSATPIRFLDRGRNMAVEYFEGNVVEGPDLPAAISAGILPTFDYITALYNLPSRMPGEENRNKYTEHLYSQLDMMQSAYSFKNILKKYITGGNHKIAVFVNRIEDIEEVKKLCVEAFPNAAHYISHSKRGSRTAQRAIRLFTEDTGMSFIYTVNILNEGVHVSGVDCVVMFRKTESPTVYLQQIGRALASDMAGKRVKLFDFVANHRNLKAVKGGSGTIIEWIQGEIKEPMRQIVIRDYAMEELEVLERLKGILSPYWTKEEDALVIEKYNDGKGVKELLPLLPKRTRSAIQQRASDLGLATYKNLRETGLYDSIKELYLTEGGMKKLLKMYPETSRSTISGIANKMGLFRKTTKVSWTDEEEEKVLELLESGLQIHEIAAITGRDKFSIRAHCILKGYISDDHEWTEEEDLILYRCRFSKDKTVKERNFSCLKTEAVHKRRAELHITFEEVWNDENKREFKRLYSIGGAENVKTNPMFRELSGNRIRALAQEFGYKCEKSRWTVEEQQLIIDWLKTPKEERPPLRTLEPKLPSHTFTCIQSMRTHLKNKMEKEAEANGTDTETTGAADPTDTKAEA